MSRRPQTIRSFLLIVAVAASTLALTPVAASASPGGHASFSIGFGHGWYHHGGFYYRHYYPSFYYYPSAYWWGYPAPAYPAAYENVGAVQLKVSPKKTDVYVDGRYVGRSGKYDGFPGYLWLERGDHSLVFYKDGFRTLQERVEVRAGMITEVHLEMEPGEAIEPSELFSAPRRPAEAAPPAAAPRTAPRPPAADTEQRAETPPDRTLDLRADGGQVRLNVEPADATVYLDGRFLGTGSDLARLHGGLLVDAGQHTLDVLHPNYQAERLSFRVEAGEDLEVRVKLDRPRQGSPAQRPAGSRGPDSGSATR